MNSEGFDGRRGFAGGRGFCDRCGGAQGEASVSFEIAEGGSVFSGIGAAKE